MGYLRKLWLDWFTEEYKVTVWYKGGTQFDPKTTKRVYNLKKITTKKPTHLVGVKTDGNSFEIKTVEPFDYQIEKIH
jgi:hypothetical protein